MEQCNLLLHLTDRSNNKFLLPPLEQGVTIRFGLHCIPTPRE